MTAPADTNPLREALDCKFCRTTCNGGERPCASLVAAKDCPWMSGSDWDALDAALASEPVAGTVMDCTDHIARLETELQRVSKNSCCTNSREAVNVARTALASYVGLAKELNTLSAPPAPAGREETDLLLRRLQIAQDDCMKGGLAAAAILLQDARVQIVRLSTLSPQVLCAGEPVAWVVLSSDTDNLRIWWRDKERADKWAAEHDRPLIPLYAKPFAAADFLPLATTPAPGAADRAAVIEECAKVVDSWKDDLSNAGVQFDKDGDIFRIAGLMQTIAAGIRALAPANTGETGNG